jgi:hypothetical protein
MLYQMAEPAQNFAQGDRPRPESAITARQIRMSDLGKSGGATRLHRA